MGGEPHEMGRQLGVSPDQVPAELHTLTVITVSVLVVMYPMIRNIEVDAPHIVIIHFFFSWK